MTLPPRLTNAGAAGIGSFSVGGVASLATASRLTVNQVGTGATSAPHTAQQAQQAAEQTCGCSGQASDRWSLTWIALFSCPVCHMYSGARGSCGVLGGVRFHQLALCRDKPAVAHFHCRLWMWRCRGSCSRCTTAERSRQGFCGVLVTVVCLQCAGGVDCKALLP